MFSSETLQRDSNNTSLLFSPNNNSFKHASEMEFLKSREFMGSEYFQQQGNGLARYRSAPSSFLATLLESTVNNNNNSSSGDESDTIFSDLMNGTNIDLNEKNNNVNPVQYSMKQEINSIGFSNGSSAASVQVGYQNPVNNGGGAIVGSYAVGMESQVQVRMSSNGNVNSSNLVRQSSSPAGFFSGFGVMGEGGNYRLSNGSHGEANSSTSTLKNHLNFSSRASSSSRFMPSIPENGNENMGTVSPPNNSHFNTLKRNREGDVKLFANFDVMENQNAEPARKYSPGLTHHLSLPKPSVQMAAVDKFLQFQQDTVPCQIRAKRGCATHPRSIAERMRRTRISERMKKLQDLFPNLDKQTNTADMLDLAVEYIKDLQKQVETLTDRRAKCSCSSKSRQ